MAGMSTRDIVKEEIQAMDEGMKRLSKTKEDIWQDEMIWWILKSVRTLLLLEFTRLLKGGENDGKDQSAIQ